MAVDVSANDRLARARAGHWQPPSLLPGMGQRYLVVGGLLLYLVLAGTSINLDWNRIAEGWSRGLAFASGFAHPDFTSRGGDILEGLLESLAMTLVATVLGIALSIPVGLGAARNLSPLPVYLFCRGLIMVSRTFQEVIIAILFVVMFGFGPLAGVATLAFATIGFIAKLLAEAIEDINARPLEAIRATGGSWLQVMNHAVQPQIMPRLIGLSLYRLDINFRESAIIGIVGAGGIGATLGTAMDRYEYNTAAAVLLIIIAIVLATEYFSGHVRRWLQ
ncbi:phosphonate ABC transporter, permease protein PhnE [Pseudomonas daroniae]|uniref:Phosphonate ABC transporter, permease protein PhnE n=1 Tax=Phytopseudomonas daroniae TaxID=2487519 RepID=A0A4Q9QHY1_9GAMM|nr:MULTISPECIES: phosphonate ABC transporter, permease protein PhnE [Pseudomonas]TBU75007.1 phosphonate ABC transporter, permease protein PhnE [Pseudomonas daroniae]TBU75264.1 phosphonate ABC transporter, permease protein PhnE [Pseudomonas daroniae]TBU80379.1 phosphonate ABC transporter, permease protein PhnE [Pseudomonas sp. FRB 228]TBU89106.1 phosphonate ABC transporter, permease protein PhnE [Pseudomonas daroniae]